VCVCVCVCMCVLNITKETLMKHDIGLKAVD